MSLDLPVTEIRLDRGDTGLGFNIRGGIDIPHLPGDPGIFVTKLKENGAAFRDGRLKEGDKIVEINGKNIERVTHNEAVQLFLQSGNVVDLKVQCGAEAAILAKIEDRRRSPVPFRTNPKKSEFSLFYFMLGMLSVSGLAYLVYRRMKK
ncbi:LOW QUALITY PROTEIN: synaptojanin-2-binding protein-like [Gigantopelta aegis]|uniref:LOW QUALITY PROTEIN: synaptojanin-2-binding protein-like n=1 Tax=Gigantopelta aegis TaxID=1735272 RepID=UPI001B887BC2|nr:LOW QUALITY PROTEIN: synaptojanin-2-binding protein-like [Gigantopelta aegis]